MSTSPKEPLPDFLEEDPELPGKQYAVVAFLSPEKVLARKELFLFKEFRRQYVVDVRLKAMESFMAFLSKKYGMRVDDVMKDFQDFSKVHADKPDFTYSDVEEAWELWNLNHGKAAQKAFDESVSFQTNVRGIKIRDFAASLPEAQAKAKKYAQMDGNKFDLGVVSVGKWVPWDPKPEEAESTEYGNEKLNELMHKYHENQAKKEAFWREQKDEQMKAALQENLERQRQNELLKSKELTDQ